MKKLYFYFLLIVVFLSIANFSFAKTDIALSPADITFSKDTIVEGDTVKIYARVFNLGDTDVLAQVVFSNNKKEMPNPQPVSLKPGTYDDVFIIWKPSAGAYNIEANVANVNPVDDAKDNNTVKKEVLIDSDTDHDGIGNKKDPDIDGDELQNDKEATMGTNPIKADTDGDTINDKNDAFPLDKTKWVSETVSENTSADENSNSTPEADEGDPNSIYYKLTKGTGGKISLDSNKFPLSMLNAAASFFGVDENYIYFSAAVLFLIIILFLLNLRKKKKY